MSEREMLEMAARAAGMQGDFALDDDDRVIHCEARGFMLGYSRGWWNPLADDGDALRLAVRLEIQAGYTEFSGEGVALWNRGNCQAREYGPDDPCAATRLAIVRASAEIGREMSTDHTKG